MMAPLPTALVAWRIDAAAFATTWDSGLGAERAGGRWNPAGMKAVYCAIDPATCLVEIAVHRGFVVLDTRPHVLTGMEILDATNVHVAHPADIPNPAWLHGGTPSGGQQLFGAMLLGRHDFVLSPARCPSGAGT